MDLRIKLKIFKEMVNEFRTKNMASTLFVENYFHKKIFVFHVEYNKSMKKYHYLPLLNFERGPRVPLLNFAGGSWGPTFKP